MSSLKAKLNLVNTSYSGRASGNSIIFSSVSTGLVAISSLNRKSSTHPLKYGKNINLDENRVVMIVKSPVSSGYISVREGNENIITVSYQIEAGEDIDNYKTVPGFYGFDPEYPFVIFVLIGSDLDFLLQLHGNNSVQHNAKFDPEYAFSLITDEEKDFAHYIGITKFSVGEYLV